MSFPSDCSFGIPASSFPRSGASNISRAIQFPRAVDQLGRSLSFFGRLGDHVLFYGRALAGMPHAAVYFRREIIRLIAEISMGAGTLAMIGGTVVIVGF